MRARYYIASFARSDIKSPALRIDKGLVKNSKIAKLGIIRAVIDFSK